MCLLPLVACVLLPVFLRKISLEKLMGEFRDFFFFFFQIKKIRRPQSVSIHILSHSGRHFDLSTPFSSWIWLISSKPWNKSIAHPVNGEFSNDRDRLQTIHKIKWATLTSINSLVATFKKSQEMCHLNLIRVEKWPVCVSDVTTRDCLHKARSPPIDHAKPPPPHTLVSPKWGVVSFSCLSFLVGHGPR